MRGEDGPGSWLWWGKFDKENKFAKKLAKKAASLVK